MVSKLSTNGRRTVSKWLAHGQHTTAQRQRAKAVAAHGKEGAAVGTRLASYLGGERLHAGKLKDVVALVEGADPRVRLGHVVRQRAWWRQYTVSTR